MVWDDVFDTAGASVSIELVGTNLRLKGTVSLGRFARLTDLINASSGYLRVRDALLLQRNGEPTDLVLPELMVDQDEISFIAEVGPRPAPEADAESGDPEAGAAEPTFAAATETRRAREYVMFTPGHTVTGKVYVFGQTDLAGFVDATDPRFVPVTDVTTRSLSDRRIVSRYDFLLVNWTQMIAASEIAQAVVTPGQDAIREEAGPDL